MLRTSRLLNRWVHSKTRSALFDKILDVDVQVSDAALEKVKYADSKDAFVKSLTKDITQSMEVAFGQLKLEPKVASSPWVIPRSPICPTVLEQLAPFERINLIVSCLDDDAMKDMNFILREEKSTTDIISMPIDAVECLDDVGLDEKAFLTDLEQMPGMTKEEIAQMTDLIQHEKHERGENKSEFKFGELIISVETAEQQARTRGHDLQQELRILACHGIVHLLGFDHDYSDDAFKDMLEAEQSLLKALGWDANGGLIEHSTK